MPGQKYSFLNKANPWERRGRGEGVVRYGRRSFLLIQREENNTLFLCLNFPVCLCHLLTWVKSGCVLWVLGWVWSWCSFNSQICGSDRLQPSRDDFMRDSGNDSFFYFLSHITSFVLLIVSWWETQKLLLRWQSGNCLNKCFWRGTRKQSQLFFHREAESLPRKVTTEKTDSKEIF